MGSCAMVARQRGDPLLAKAPGAAEVRRDAAKVFSDKVGPVLLNGKSASKLKEQLSGSTDASGGADDGADAPPGAAEKSSAAEASAADAGASSGTAEKSVAENVLAANGGSAERLAAAEDFVAKAAAEVEAAEVTEAPSQPERSASADVAAAPPLGDSARAEVPAQPDDVSVPVADASSLSGGSASTEALTDSTPASSAIAASPAGGDASADATTASERGSSAADAQPDVIATNPSEAHRQAIVNELMRFDRNGDGRLDKEELGEVLERLLEASLQRSDSMEPVMGVSTSELVQVVLNEFDSNGDGYIDSDELVDWVARRTSISPVVPSLSIDAFVDDPHLETTHTFLTPLAEAKMERMTLWELCGAENSRVFEEAGLGSLQDDGLLVLSVGSSSTQVYDAKGLAASFPLGTRVCNPAALAAFASALREATAGRDYGRAVCVNSIGYLLETTDPKVLELAALVQRRAAAAAAASSSAGVVDSASAVAESPGRDTTASPALNSAPDIVSGVYEALCKALPDTRVMVFNRSKDSATKRYKYAQIVNDFSLALTAGRCLADGSDCNAEAAYDTIVDWGGASYKIYVGGKRVATEIFDANSFLCDGDHLLRERLPRAVAVIKRHVLEVAPITRRLLIAQTGRARELALI